MSIEGEPRGIELTFVVQGDCRYAQCIEPDNFLFEGTQAEVNVPAGYMRVQSVCDRIALQHFGPSHPDLARHARACATNSLEQRDAKIIADGDGNSWFVIRPDANGHETVHLDFGEHVHATALPEVRIIQPSVSEQKNSNSGNSGVSPELIYASSCVLGAAVVVGFAGRAYGRMRQRRRELRANYAANISRLKIAELEIIEKTDFENPLTQEEKDGYQRRTSQRDKQREAAEKKMTDALAQEPGSFTAPTTVKRINARMDRLESYHIRRGQRIRKVLESAREESTHQDSPDQEGVGLPAFFAKVRHHSP